MADGFDVKLEGLEELQGKLKSLSDDMQLKGGRFALRRAAQVLRDKARQNAGRVDDPATTESIEANVVERWNGRLYRRTGNLGFRVGVLGGARGFAAASGEVKGAGSGNPGGDTFYWRFLEFGTAKMAAQPFMRPSADQAAGDVVDEFVRQYNKAADRALRRAKKK